METVIEEMTMEDLDGLMIQEEVIARFLGFVKASDLYDYKYHACEGMMRFGGSFTRPLGHALASADSQNTVKLINTWRTDCDHHAELHREFIRRRDAERENEPSESDELKRDDDIQRARDAQQELRKPYYE